MYPFHRQHRNNNGASSSSSSRHSNHGHGRSSRERSGRSEQRHVESEPPSPTHEQSGGSLHRHIPAHHVLKSVSVLRAKERVLLSSMSRLYEPCPADNRRRLGPSTEDVFGNLRHRAKSCDILNQVPDSSVPNDQCKVEREDLYLPGTQCKETTSEKQQASGPDTKDFTLPITQCNISSRDAVSDNSNKKKLSSKMREVVSCETDVMESLRQVDSTATPDSVVVEINDDNEQSLTDNCIKIVLTPSNIRTINIAPNPSCNASLDEAITPNVENQVNDVEAAEQVATSGDEASQVSDSHDDDDVICKPHPDPPPLTNVAEPIALSSAVELKRVVLGSGSSVISSQWLVQGFVFNSHQRMRYGFVQIKGGCCFGVLAPVQAYLLRALLFEAGGTKCTEPLRPTRSEVRAALVRAMAHILWQAGDHSRAALATYSEQRHLSSSPQYNPDGVTERLQVSHYSSRAQLEGALCSHLDQLLEVDGAGCLLFLLSVVLSRGPDRVLQDMDEPTPLITPRDGHCSLELVMLLVTGKAVSNLFDNSIKTATSELHGVPTRGEVGLLSLAEYSKVLQVGSYLKTPRVPIWVIVSGSSYSVLFSCRRDLVSDWRAEKRFNLYYYDGIAKHHDEIKLTVDTTGHNTRKRVESEVVPPVELCILTKWKGAAVIWNDTQ